MPYEIISYLQTLNLVDYCLIGAIVFIWLFRFLFDIIFYGRLAFRKVAPAGSSSLPITVFIVERNEEDRLRSNLPNWLQMGYPNYEVLVVDDFSEDNSTAALALLKNDFPRLRFTALSQETRYSDKLARNLALKAASHEMVVMIHPAMLPPDNHWLPGISAAVSNGKDVVIGYCNLVPRKEFNHKLFRVESFFQQIESMACSITGMPYVTAEENVTFRKSAYFVLGGLAGKIREEYLNLELVVNEIVSPKNVAVLPVGNLTLRKEIEVDHSMLRDLYSKSFRMKQYLKRGTRFFLGFSRLTGILLLPLLIFSLILYPGLQGVVAGLVIIKSVAFTLIIKRIQKRLHEPKLFVTSLLYAIVAPYYRSVAQWRYNLIRKNRKWSN